MVKNICFIFLLLFATSSFAASEYDKDIVVKNQTRNDKVKTVFKEMMKAYEEEDIDKFFSYVSEDRFLQDYMTFYDAIDKDMRIYDILNVDTWVNKIDKDGVKRFLYVRWTKRYESSKPVKLNRSDLATSDENEIVQNGTTEFLFDEINGKYKLIKIAGNNFWGRSLKEWKEEVGDISGQESKEIAGDNVNGEYQNGGGSTAAVELPDLTIECVQIDNYNYKIKISNIGSGDTTEGLIHYKYLDVDYMTREDTYPANISAGDSIIMDGSGGTVNSYCYDGGFGEVNPLHSVAESNYDNNTYPSNINVSHP